jgi:hypothetical protein
MNVAPGAFSLSHIALNKAAIGTQVFEAHGTNYKIPDIAGEKQYSTPSILYTQSK